MSIIIICIIIGIILYFLLGFGCSRLIATLKKREISLIEIILWPAALIVYAFIGDIK